MSIGKEIGMDFDDFDQQRVYTDKDTVARLMMNILFMKPGHLPNLPHIGIDINQYLYKQEDGFDTSELQNRIASQCSELMPYMLSGEITVKFSEHNGLQFLLIGIPISLESDDDLLLIGLSPTDGNKIAGTSSTSMVYEFTKLV